MILSAALAALVGIVVFFIGEAIRRKLKRGNEDSRKLIHTIHGLTVISWVFLTNHRFIIAFEIFFFVAMFVFKYVAHKWPQLLGWVYKVGRDSYGEFFYPLGVIGVVLLGKSNWFIIAALLQLAVADAVAAIVGKSWGKTNGYKILGGTKSAAGTAAFVLSSVIILAIVLLPTQPHTLGLWLVIGILPFVLAALENVSVKGSDNLTIPLAAGLALRFFL